MPVDHAAIAAVKFGRRRLTSPAALARLNKVGRDPDYANFFGVLAANATTIALVTAINEKARAIFDALGLTALASGLGDNLAFSFEGPDYSVPKIVWNGHFPLPLSASATPAQDKAQYLIALKNYKRACGDFRKHFARSWATFSALNDMSNEAQKPNPGGVAGHDKGA